MFIVCKGQDLESVPPLDDNTYTPGGGTALYDAIAHSVRLAEKDKTSNEQVVCVIMTDGEENSSKETTKQQVKDIITSKEKTGEWSFLYIGENPEQWASDYKVDANRVAQFDGPLSMISVRASNKQNVCTVSCEDRSQRARL